MKTRISPPSVIFILMNLLLDPNVAYLLLVAGFSLAVLAVLTPGTGLIELAALAVGGLAAWAIFGSPAPINWWAVGLLVLGVFPFILAVRLSRRLIFLVLAIVALVIGSAYLFQGPGLLPAVNPVLALVVSTLEAIYFWVVATKVIEAEGRRPTHDLSALIGAEGEAKTNILEEGSVLVAGELWSAHSAQPITEGARVRVVGREGFILTVEPA